MFEFIKKWFKKSDSKSGQKEDQKKKPMGDSVRKYVKNSYISPARLKKQDRVSFTAAEVEKGMGLNFKYPMVCSALDAKKFLEFARVELIRREGSEQGATAKWTFKVLP